MKRTPLTRKALLRSSALTPGTQPSRKPIRRTAQTQPGGRPRAERLAGARPSGNPIPPQVRAAVRQRSGGQCELLAADDCTFQATEQHHRKRRRDGGHALSNVVDACSNCHAHAHAHPQLARDRGWIVSAFAVDPALEPIRYGDPVERHTWFADDGSKSTAYITPDRSAIHGH